MTFSAAAAAADIFKAYIHFLTYIATYTYTELLHTQNISLYIRLAMTAIFHSRILTITTLLLFVQFTEINL